MAERVLVKTVGDTPIYVDSSTGRFEATVGRQKITRQSLADVEREVSSRQAGRVELMNVRPSNQWSSWEQWPLPTKVVVVRVERERVGRHDEQTKLRLADGSYASGWHFRPWDQQVRDRLEALLRRKEALLQDLRREWDEILAQAPEPVSFDDVEAELKRQARQREARP